MYKLVSARLPDAMVVAIDSAASQMRRSRAEIIRIAIEHYLEDYDDLSVALDRIQDPNDPVLDWDEVRCDLFKRSKKTERTPRIRSGASRKAIDQLEENPYFGSGLKGDLQGLRRLRVGVYRILYEVHKNELVVRIGRRALSSRSVAEKSDRFNS